MRFRRVPKLASDAFARPKEQDWNILSALEGRPVVPALLLVLLIVLIGIAKGSVTGRGSGDVPRWQGENVEYALRGRLTDTGTLHLVEDLAVRQGVSGHGLVRWFSTGLDPNQPLSYTLWRASRDDAPVISEGVLPKVEHSRALFYIGDADTTVPAGEHRYQLEYSISNVITKEANSEKESIALEILGTLGIPTKRSDVELTLLPNMRVMDSTCKVEFAGKEIQCSRVTNLSGKDAAHLDAEPGGVGAYLYSSPTGQIVRLKVIANQELPYDKRFVIHVAWPPVG